MRVLWLDSLRRELIYAVRCLLSCWSKMKSSEYVSCDHFLKSLVIFGGSPQIGLSVWSSLPLPTIGNFSITELHPASNVCTVLTICRRSSASINFTSLRALDLRQHDILLVIIRHIVAVSLQFSDFRPTMHQNLYQSMDTDGLLYVHYKAAQDFLAIFKKISGRSTLLNQSSAMA